MDGNKREFDDIEHGRDAAHDGNPDHVPDNRVKKDESKLDQSLKDTFPASDPPSIHPGAD